MKFSKIYSGLIGVSIIVQWTIAYFSGQIIELETEPIRIGFHIAGELITAALLMISAWGLHNQTAWGRKLALISTGMLFYTALVSPGYFAQQGNWIWLGFFGIILLGGVVSVCLLAQD
jgi:hypothetical protein